MAAALTVVRSLFSLATRASTGVFLIERGGAGARGPTSRLELEQGYVHAMSNVGESPRGEDTLVALLATLPDEAQPAFHERAPRGALMGHPVAAFHPARAVRRHVELHARERPGFPPSDPARLTLRFRPHASCIDGSEAVLIAMLDRPRRFDELAAAVPRPMVQRLALFLEAAGALSIEDPAIDSAWAVLGLPVGAPPEQIKRAWRQLARELHPDLQSGHADPDHLAERFSAANAAYKRLLPGGG